MSSVWIYEYHYLNENVVEISVFQEKMDALAHAVRCAEKTFLEFNGNTVGSDYFDSYEEFINLIRLNSLQEALNLYQDWAGDLNDDEMIFHSIYEREVKESSVSYSGKRGRQSKKVPKISFSDGATCKKCQQHNEYVSESNQDDGTYLCGTCKTLGGVFGS